MAERSDVVCKKCGTPYFMSVIKVKRISAIMSGDGQEHITPIPTLVCITPDCRSEIGTGGKEKKDGK